MQTLRRAAGWAAVFGGSAFLTVAVMLHVSMDAIIRIPFVLGAGALGVLLLGVGIGILVTSRREGDLEERFREHMSTHAK